MKYKLFISDYDGTLGVAPNNDIDAETRVAIQKFTDKGGIFVVCSGRETMSITRILRNCNVKGVVVSFQGARITDIESGKKIFSSGLSVDKVLTALDEVAGTGLEPVAYGDNGELFIEKNNPYFERYKNAVGLKSTVVDLKREIREQGGNISKICWLGDDVVVNQTADRLNAKYKGEGIKFNSGAKCLLEAINPDCSKGFAVRYIADYYGVPLDQVITVGDSTNDIDLLVGPWYGVAVGDGREELKAVADEITVPFKDKPVKTLLEKYCLD